VCELQLQQQQQQQQMIDAALQLLQCQEHVITRRLTIAMLPIKSALFCAAIGHPEGSFVTGCFKMLAIISDMSSVSILGLYCAKRNWQ